MLMHPRGDSREYSIHHAEMNLFLLLKFTRKTWSIEQQIISDQTETKYPRELEKMRGELLIEIYVIAKVHTQLCTIKSETSS